MLEVTKNANAKVCNITDACCYITGITLKFNYRKEMHYGKKQSYQKSKCSYTY